MLRHASFFLLSRRVIGERRHGDLGLRKFGFQRGVWRPLVTFPVIFPTCFQIVLNFPHECAVYFKQPDYAGGDQIAYAGNHGEQQYDPLHRARRLLGGVEGEERGALFLL